MATDNRALPLAILRLYDPGEGDPLMLDPGWGWYDILKHSYQYGASSLDAQGISYLRYIEDIGLACREYLVLQDTKLSDYTTSGGAWEERRPLAGEQRTARLVQYSTAPAGEWSAVSTYSLPANPDFAISLLPGETPPDHDSDTYPPYVRFEWGGSWALQFTRYGGATLLHCDSGAWREVKSLSAGENGLGERVVMVRMQRGKLCISSDLGQSWTLAENTDGSAVEVASGPVAWRGQGMACACGLHQLRYCTAVYTSPRRRTNKARTAATPTLAPWGNSPAGGSITAADASPESDVAQYTLTLTPEQEICAPFSIFRSPDVQAMQWEYPVSLAAGLGSYVDYGADRILSIEIDHPLELDGSTATITLRRFRTDPQPADNLRWRKVQILLAWMFADGSVSAPVVAFTGHVRRPEYAQDKYGVSTLTLTCDGGAVRAKRVKWSRARGIVPLGGKSVNEALDVCLKYIGLGTSDRVWDAVGDRTYLPAGLAEDPCLLPRDGEPVWETMEAIAAYAGMEISPDNAGIWRTVPRGYVDSVVSAQWEANPAIDAGSALASIHNSVDYGESYTAVTVTGADEQGAAIAQSVRDTAAESDKGCPRYCPWPEDYSENVSGTSSLGILALYAQGLAVDKLALSWRPDVTGPCRVELNRRQRVRVVGSNQRVSDGDELAVLTMHHTFSARQGELKTTAGLVLL